MKTIRLSLILAMLSLLAVFVPRLAQAEPPKDMIRMNIGAEPFSLDPNLANDIPSSKVLRHLFEGLVRLDSDCVPHPGAAESWDHNEDFTVWTFHLRKEAKWSNGDPVVAGDWVYSLHRILDPALGAQYAQFVYNFLAGGKQYYDSKAKDDSAFGAKAIDAHTLEIRLSAPTPFFVTILGHSSWYPIHKGTIEKNGEKWSRTPAAYVCNGPFTLEEWRPKDRIIVKKNPGYFAAKDVKLNKVEFRCIEEESTSLAAFESGELDIIDRVPLPEVDRLRELPVWQSGPYLGTYYVCFNVTKPPFNDVALRKAFSLAINRKKIVERITKRGEKPSEGYVPHGIRLANGQDYREFAPKLINNSDQKANVEAAKKILADAGYGKDKPLPRVEYLYNTSDEHKTISEALQNMWKTSLDADVILQNVEWKVKIDRGNAKDYQFGRWGWIGDYLDPMSFLDIFETGGGNNDAGYANPKYDECLRNARQEKDADKRLKYLMEAERLLIEEDCVLAPIYSYTEPFLLKTDCKGVMRNALGDMDVSRAWRE